MPIGSSFDTGALRIRLKAAEDKVKAFESGEEYVRMQEQFESAFRKENARLEQRVLEVERQRDAALDRLRDKNHELYGLQTALYEAEQKIAGLTARTNKDYTNSSKPSSQSPNHKTIPNGKEKSGKKPGSQKGHIHHGRKRMVPTEVISIPAPPKYRDNPNFKETGSTVRKQLVKLHVGVEVVEYNTPEFRNRTTGQRVHAAFPEGLKDEVTYDGTVKAFAYLLNNECYAGIGKTQSFIKEVTGGNLNLSTGLICNLSKQFSEQTKEERDGIFRNLFSAPVMQSGLS